jgi:hypothetical protein
VVRERERERERESRERAERESRESRKAETGRVTLTWLTGFMYAQLAYYRQGHVQCVELEVESEERQRENE